MSGILRQPQGTNLHQQIAQKGNEDGTRLAWGKCAPAKNASQIKG